MRERPPPIQILYMVTGHRVNKKIPSTKNTAIPFSIFNKRKKKTTKPEGWKTEINFDPITLCVSQAMYFFTLTFIKLLKTVLKVNFISPSSLFFRFHLQLNLISLESVFERWKKDQSWQFSSVFFFSQTLCKIASKKVYYHIRSVMPHFYDTRDTTNSHKVGMFAMRYRRDYSRRRTTDASHLADFQPPLSRFFFLL